MAKILIVEDNEMNRDMLSRRLRRHGFDVCTAVDGEGGVLRATADMPDLILMDIELGALSGWDATRQIKANPQTADIPVIALTAHALETDRVKSFEVGCTDFDIKPIDMPRLLAKIEKAISSHDGSEAQLKEACG